MGGTLSLTLFWDKLLNFRKVNKSLININRQLMNTYYQKSSKGLVNSKLIILALFLITILSLFFILKNRYISEEHKLKKALTDQSIKEDDLKVEYAGAEEIFQAINNTKIKLIDIREKTEFDSKHIESSINIPLSQVSQRLNSFNDSKKIIIIDRKESLLGKILVDYLTKKNISVKYLKNGILGYVNAGYSLVDYGSPASTENLLKVKSLSKEELKNKLFSGNIITFIDVRPSVDFLKEHLPGSINIPLEKIETEKASLPVTQLILYDDDPIRSFRATVKLYDMGFWNSYNSLLNYDALKELLMELNKKNK